MELQSRGQGFGSDAFAFPFSWAPPVIAQETGYGNHVAVGFDHAVNIMIGGSDGPSALIGGNDAINIMLGGHDGAALVGGNHSLDVMVGGYGNDAFVAGNGSTEIMVGGGGHDTFVFPEQYFSPTSPSTTHIADFSPYDDHAIAHEDFGMWGTFDYDLFAAAQSYGYADANGGLNVDTLGHHVVFDNLGYYADDWLFGGGKG